MPDNLVAIAGCQPETEEEYDQTEAGNTAVGTRVICFIRLDEGAEADDGDCANGAEWESKTLWDEPDGASDDVDPEEFHRHHEVAGWDVESDLGALLALCFADKSRREAYEADHDEEPQKEWNYPAKVASVEENA